MLTFNADRHEYRWDGWVVPSVTQVLAPIVDLSRIPSDALEVARQKGVAIHKMVELDARGDLDEDALPEWLHKPLENWRKFVADTGFEVLLSEFQVYHRIYRYAGTLDLYGEMKHAAQHAFIDVKRSFVAGQATGVQVYAYKDAYISAGYAALTVKRAGRFALRLNETQNYQLEEFTDPAQFQDFLTLLAFHRTKGKYR